ncbi:hypothetical protein F5884DRAFT_374546 [Xylogone sp. PMI_703]|nr:hypothetical protein F5884DRAFT_374546 [Xylogone sp. PMI_703]
MSRLPPPPGLPARPPLPRNYGRGDSYRPGQQESYGSRDRNSGTMYPPPPSPYGYAPGTGPPRDSQTSDSYRPRPRESEFSFRYDAPPSLDMRKLDSYRPRSRSRSPPRKRHTNASQNRRGGNQRLRNGNANNRRYGPRTASDREFLKGNREPTPERMPGMEEGEDEVVRFKAIDEMSDSEEEDMDISGDENDEPDGEPKRKQARSEIRPSDGDNVPRWSNPDPYTALPPPDESQRKKKDVVKLIRKARVSTERSAKPALETDDFISFDFGEEEEEDESEEEDGQPPPVVVPGAPTGPRFSHRASLYGQQTPSSASASTAPTAPKALVEMSLDGQSRKGNELDNVPRDHRDGAQARGIDSAPDPALGSRKRTFDDRIKEPPLTVLRKGRPPVAAGSILKEWIALPGTVDTPWINIDHSQTANMGVWLHKEIMDFYHYVKPRGFEETVRAKLIQELQVKIKDWMGNADILPFGSYPAGLYLPTSDMDLVCVSQNYMDGRPPLLGLSLKGLRQFERYLLQNRLAIVGSTEVISKAKVPLVKYIDKVTGLKVDVSFENDTGLIANNTFKEWKIQFPAMPILVTLIKHILAMRGLNEPANGGIGGFSVTCLVVSLLQHMPQVQSGNMIPEHHLGEILMEFLDLYGNHFNFTTTAIELRPPRYVTKIIDNGIYKAGNIERISIIDPNNPLNDISGGSSNTARIRKCFSDAFRALQKTMAALQFSNDRKNASILRCILGGNYESFRLQREHLAHVHEQLYGPLTEDI